MSQQPDSPLKWIIRLGGDYVPFAPDISETLEMHLGPVVDGKPMIKFVRRRVETGTRRRLDEWYIFGVRCSPLRFTDARRLLKAFENRGGSK